MLSWTPVNDPGGSETQCSAIHTAGVPSIAPHWVAGGIFLANPPAAACSLPSALAPPLSTVIGVYLLLLNFRCQPVVSGDSHETAGVNNVKVKRCEQCRHSAYAGRHMHLWQALILSAAGLTAAAQSAQHCTRSLGVGLQARLLRPTIPS